MQDEPIDNEEYGSCEWDNSKEDSIVIAVLISLMVTILLLGAALAILGWTV